MVCFLLKCWYKERRKLQPSKPISIPYALRAFELIISAPKSAGVFESSARRGMKDYTSSHFYYYSTSTPISLSGGRYRYRRRLQLDNRCATRQLFPHLSPTLYHFTVCGQQCLSLRRLQLVISCSF